MPESDNRSLPVPALLLSTATASVLTLAVYVLLSGSNPLNRIGYAVFVSLTPAIITLVAMKIWRLSTRFTVIVYTSLFWVIIIVQGVMRNV